MRAYPGGVLPKWSEAKRQGGETEAGTAPRGESAAFKSGLGHPAFTGALRFLERVKPVCKPALRERCQGRSVEDKMMGRGVPGQAMGGGPDRTGRELIPRIPTC